MLCGNYESYICWYIPPLSLITILVIWIVSNGIQSVMAYIYLSRLNANPQLLFTPASKWIKQHSATYSIYQLQHVLLYSISYCIQSIQNWINDIQSTLRNYQLDFGTVPTVGYYLLSCVMLYIRSNMFLHSLHTHRLPNGLRAT